MKNISKIRIVADSSADVIKLDGASFASAPLKIVTAEKEYVDDENLDVYEMVTDLKNYKGRSSSSCPNANDYLEAFGGAERVICITITATLSGSYNSAMLAKKMYEEENPERKVHVINSLSTGPELVLAIEKLCELIDGGLEFEEVCRKIDKYITHTGLLFMLESLKNLANNGRVSAVVAKMAGLLGIRLVGKASDKGDLEPVAKCRGEKKALESILSALRELGYKGGKIKLGHCFNENAAKQLKEMIVSLYKDAKVEIYALRGLCSFYAEMGGMLVGFEKDGATV